MRTALSVLTWLTLSVAAGACNSNNAEEDKATSIPIDSTSQSGAPSVQYGADNPAGDTSTSTGSGESVIQDNDGMRSHPYSGEDNTNYKKAGDATNTNKVPDNTTDARSTSGSARGTDTSSRRR